MINEKSEEFSNSQFALKAYMDFKDSNAYMHEAMVLFPANGKSANGIFKFILRLIQIFHSLRLLATINFQEI